jgi:uncharacterized membrane protein YphA (DoxX/SURF4 family)
VLARLAAVALGAVLLISGVGKLADARRWRAEGAELFGVPVVLGVLPYLEVVLGALLIAGWRQPVVATAAALLLGAFTALLVVRLAQGRHPPCACFGRLSHTPLGRGHVVRDLGLIGLAVIAAM